MMNRTLALSVVLCCSLSQQAQAGESAGSHCRAGHPTLISRCAQCTYDHRYVGYYVGGGAKRGHGECRYCHEGTWGVDYRPIVPGFRRGVVLNWWHGLRDQDGGGTYEPDHANDPFKSLKARHGW